jgi:hypothetical protein
MKLPCVRRKLEMFSRAAATLFPVRENTVGSGVLSRHRDHRRHILAATAERAATRKWRSLRDHEKFPTEVAIRVIRATDYGISFQYQKPNM